MGQLIKVYMMLYIVPFLTGVAVRFLCRHIKRGYVVTLLIFVLAVIAWVVLYTVPANGDQLHGFTAHMATSAAVGAVLAGLITQLKQNT